MGTKTKSNIAAIGWYQIIGGAIGVILLLYLVFSLIQFSALNILIYVFMLLFFAYSIFCGILCIKYKGNALTHSLINQCLQLMGFAVLGFGFTYIAGTYLSVGLDLSNSVDMKFDIGISKFDFNINRDHERTEINFNLGAFVLVYWIEKLIKEIKEEKINDAIAAVGQ
jgi:hypothetical protein